MYKFGDDWTPAKDKKSTEVVLTPAQQAAEANKFKPPSWTNTAILIISVLGFIVINTLVFGKSGNFSTGGSARSLVFVFEGFKGTVFEQVVMQGNKAPNLKRLINGRKGKYAACLSTRDSRCAQTQSGARLGGFYNWGSAPGIASILSGVNANKHQVYNDSYKAMTSYSATSQDYPSFLKYAGRAGLRTAVVGSHHLLTSVNPESGACDKYGVLDFECGTSTVLQCLRQSSCNADSRIAVSAQLHGSKSEEAAIPDIAAILEEGAADMLVVHIPRLAITGTTTGDFAATSATYVANIYLLDAVVGQILRLLDERINRLHESWLVVGTSDHGGYRQTYGTNSGEDEVVPFFVVPVMAGGATLDLNDLKIPTKQFDVAPTLLKWHGLLTDEIAAAMDGVVQAICSDGKQPMGCAEAAALAAKVVDRSGTASPNAAPVEAV